MKVAIAAALLPTQEMTPGLSKYVLRADPDLVVAAGADYTIRTAPPRRCPRAPLPPERAGAVAGWCRSPQRPSCGTPLTFESMVQGRRGARPGRSGGAGRQAQPADNQRPPAAEDIRPEERLQAVIWPALADMM